MKIFTDFYDNAGGRFPITGAVVIEGIDLTADQDIEIKLPADYRYVITSADLVSRTYGAVDEVNGKVTLLEKSGGSTVQTIFDEDVTLSAQLDVQSLYSTIANAVNGANVLVVSITGSDATTSVADLVICARRL